MKPIIQKLLLALILILASWSFRAGASVGTISTVAGNYSSGGSYSGDSGAATSAGLSGPLGICFENSSTWFIADLGNGAVREVSSGTISTALAPDYTSGYLDSPLGVAIDSANDLFVADGDWGKLLEFDNWSDAPGLIGSDPVLSVARDSSGNLYCVNESASSVSLREPVGSGGGESAFAGTGTAGYSGDSGAATSAKLSLNYWIFTDYGVVVASTAVDGSGNVYIADIGNNRIRKVNTSGTISTIAGNGTAGYTGDGGAATSAELNHPGAVAVDTSGNVYIADTKNNCIREVNTSGTISTIAGTGTAGYSGDGGAAVSAEFNVPGGLALDPSGNLYVSDTGNNVVREISFSTVAILTSSSPSAGGTTSGGGVVTYDSSVTVTATPATGYTFVNWTEGGTAVSTSASYTFTANANISLVANFLPTVSISATLSNAYQANGDPGIFTISRSAGTASSLTVNLAVSGAATADVNYPAINSQITIPTGASSTTVYVWPSPDNLDESAKTVIATLSTGSYIIGSSSSATVSINDDPASPLANPSSTGSYSYSEGTYLDSTTKNFSSFGGTSNVAITGVVDVPSGSGPFPLVVFMHGEPSSTDADADTDTGFLYLCNLLASNGIVAASISYDPDDDGGYIGFAVLALEHVKYLASQYNIDTTHIMLVGHSGGADGIDWASYYNTYTGPGDGIGTDPPVPLNGSEGFGPYDFGLQGIVGFGEPDSEEFYGCNVNYLNIAGTLDGFYEDRQSLYDRTEPLDLADPSANANGFKASVAVVGANHPFWNTLWDECSATETATADITAAQQEQVAQVYVGAMAQAVLLDQPQYLKFLESYDFAASDLDGVATVSQFQPADHLWIENYDNDNSAANPATLSAPLTSEGSASWSVASPGDISVSTEQSDFTGVSTFALAFVWSESSDYYKLSFSGTGLNSTGYSFLSLRIGQAYASNNPGGNQHLRIVVQDTSGNSAYFGISVPPFDGGGGPVPSETVWVPLNGMETAGVDVTHIASVTLEPEPTPLGNSTGTVALTDIFLSN